jgi:hypothetical protein
MIRVIAIFTSVIAITLTLSAPASVAGDYQQSFASGATRIASGCIPCATKCRRCTGNGGAFSTVKACLADCDRRGNPMSSDRCGIFEGCM